MDLVYICICFLVWFILGGDINVDSITLENTIQSNKKFTLLGSQSTLKRIKSTHYVSADTQNSIESSDRLFCKSEQKPIVKVCTDDKVLDQRIIFIDTVSVPIFQNNLCECVVTPLKQPITMSLQLKNLSGRRYMQFKINKIEINKFYKSGRTNITGDTKLLFSTTKDHQKKGVCLAVYSEDDTKFNMTCKKSTRRTTRKPSPASTRGTTRKPSPASTRRTTRKPSPASTRKTTRKPSPASTRRTPRKPSPASTTETTRKPSTASTRGTTRKPSPASTTGTTRKPSPASTTGKTRKPSPASTTGTTRKPSPASPRGTTRQFSSASISHESETTKLTTIKYYNSSVQASKDKATGVNAIIIPTVSAACGLLFGIVIAVVCVIVYKRKKRGKGKHATMIIPADANVESDYYMTENAMYNMGEICRRQPTNENEHHNFDHDAGAYAGVSPGHYDCIQESTDRNQSSDIAPTHAVSNEYSTCLKAGQVTAGGLNKNTSNNYQKYQPKGSRINGEDDTVYDSTKSSLPQQAVGNDDYHHLDSVGFNDLNLTYDKIGNTGVVKY